MVPFKAQLEGRRGRINCGAECEPGRVASGCVIEAYLGNYDMVRVVRVKTKDKDYLRPVHRLCPLKYADDNVEE